MRVDTYARTYARLRAHAHVAILGSSFNGFAALCLFAFSTGMGRARGTSAGKKKQGEREAKKQKLEKEEEAKPRQNELSCAVTAQRERVELVRALAALHEQNEATEEEQHNSKDDGGKRDKHEDTRQRDTKQAGKGGEQSEAKGTAKEKKAETRTDRSPTPVNGPVLSGKVRAFFALQQPKKGAFGQLIGNDGLNYPFFTPTETFEKGDKVSFVKGPGKRTGELEAKLVFGVK